MTHVSQPPSLLLKSWGTEAVIYDTASGDTHYLKPFTLALYQICSVHPVYTSAQLAAMLAARLELADTPELLELTEDTLNHLRKIRLLESV